MEKDIGKVPKNQDSDIVVRIDDFGGKIGVTIREFVHSDRYTGFTKAGTRISAENFKAFKDLINSIDENELAAMKPSEEAIEKSKKFAARNGQSNLLNGQKKTPELSEDETAF
ncbi:MAG: hypothetical protein QXS38_00790 [Candidatus Pacearchaeota archaeon]